MVVPARGPRFTMTITWKCYQPTLLRPVANVNMRLRLGRAIFKRPLTLFIISLHRFWGTSVKFSHSLSCYDTAAYTVHSISDNLHTHHYTFWNPLDVLSNYTRRRNVDIIPRRGTYYYTYYCSLCKQIRFCRNVIIWGQVALSSDTLGLEKKP